MTKHKNSISNRRSVGVAGDRRLRRDGRHRRLVVEGIEERDLLSALLVSGFDLLGQREPASELGTQFPALQSAPQTQWPRIEIQSDGYLELSVGHVTSLCSNRIGIAMDRPTSVIDSVPVREYFGGQTAVRQSEKITLTS
jgi:hypothetical protein